jgi:hypothetical protein
MANPTTAAEWKEVAANAQAQIDAVNQQKAQGEAQITALEQQLLANGQQISDYLKANPRITSRDPGLLALEAQTNTIKQNLATTEVYVRATLTSQLFQLRATINNANRQAGVATTGAPNTSTNTPPETVVPNQSNTVVTTTTEPEPIQQSVIDPNSDPEILVDQDDTGFEPLQEPPSTADEFDGIDTQIDNNENALQEPPLLSDEEIDQQIGLAAAQEETITSPDSITENVFDPRQDAQESVFDPRQEVTENVFDPTAGGGGQGISTSLNKTRSTATKDDSVNFQQKPDWRARLSLAPNANYLYKVPKGQDTFLP